MAIDPNEKYGLLGSQVTDLATRIKTAQSTADGASTAAAGKQDALTTAQLNAVNSGITSAGVTKLNGIAAGAEVNVQADWSVSDNNSDAFIKNKPTIPAAQVQSDWNQSNSGAVDYIKNKPVIPPGSILYGETGNHTDGAMTQKATTEALPTTMVGATSGADGASGLVPQPLIANRGQFLRGDGTWVANTSANDKTITISNNGTTVDSFTTNASSNKTIALSYPVITMQSTDPGEGVALAANNFIAYYEA